MTDTLPDRLSQNPKSPYYNKELLERGIGIRFNGQEKTNVWEYCISEGWVRVVAGVAMDRKGNHDHAAQGHGRALFRHAAAGLAQHLQEAPEHGEALLHFRDSDELVRLVRLFD